MGRYRNRKEMNIKFGELFDNKTWKFLSPTLRGHGDTFVTKFNRQVFKLAYGVNDTLMEGMPLFEGKRPLFILCDRGVLANEFKTFLDWLRYQPYYITDYQADTNLVNPRMHMIVVSVPEEYNTAYDKFCVGLYSEMYTKEQMGKLFTDKETEQYKILSRSPEYSSTFFEKVAKEFNVELIERERKEFIDVAEYEFPYSLNSKDEIFNF